VRNTQLGVSSSNSMKRTYYSIVSEGRSHSNVINEDSTRIHAYGKAQYRFALMRDIDESLVTEALRLHHDNNSNVDLKTAKEHKARLANVLSQDCGIHITQLPSDGYPDSVFIEDTAVIIGNTALITNPGAPVLLILQLILYAQNG
jgi:hypothetical protein